ncbi:MAG: aminotransferase class V-fold PLP-dependent enzyme [Eubacterium sp.]
MIYLDNAATTFPKPEEVYTAMDNANRYFAINSGRGSYKKAREVSTLISETKSLLRNLMNANNGCGVVLSPSITIALNQIINGIEWKNNSIIYLSPYEHNAVARTVNFIAKRRNIKVKLLPLNENNLEIDIEKTKYEFSKDKPDAIFCTHVSNVTGYILPVQQIFDAGKKYNCITVLDSAQSLGLIPVDSSIINADIIAFTGHKTLYGSFGIGGFLNVGNIPLKEFIVGGTGSDSLNLDMPQDKEGKYESASSNIIAIAGLNAALKVLNQEEAYKKEVDLTQYLIEKIKTVTDIKIYVPEDKSKHIGIVSFTVEGMNSNDIGEILDEDYDIAVRTGYHCAPYIHSFLKDEKYLGTVRIGIGQFNKKKELDELVEAISKL